MAASVAPAIIGATVAGVAIGLVSVETMLTVTIAAGENPGMVTFGAMYLASPVQWSTGRSQIAVRKYLGIVFFLLAASNGAMFAVEHGPTRAIDEPLLIAGTIALAAALPLFLTSTRRAQRRLGMRRWRSLHRGVHVIAIALLAHVALIGDIGPGAGMITLGLVARTPPVQRALQSLGDQRRGRWRR